MRDIAAKTVTHVAVCNILGPLRNLSLKIFPYPTLKMNLSLNELHGLIIH